MIAQVTAAALASENKALAHPHSVDSLPTSANQEDHVSMAPAAGRRLWEMAANTRGIIAVEWLAACQGIDLREGLTSSPLLEQARQTLRERVAHYTQDRFFAPDIECATALLAQGALQRLVPDLCECCRMARRYSAYPTRWQGKTFTPPSGTAFN